MRRLLGCLVAIAAFGCGKDEDAKNDTGNGAGPVSAPERCVADEEVCASYSADWSTVAAAEHCEALGGTEGECPDGETGVCLLDDGLSYHLYMMPAMEAEGYCDWFGGTWTASE